MKEGEQLVQKAAYGPKNPEAHDITNPIILKLGEGICGAVAQSGVSEMIGDTSKDTRYTVDDAFRFSELTVPILHNDEVIGIIDTEHSEKDFYKEQDLEILETIASIASVKITQTQAIDELLEHKLNLERQIEGSTIELRDIIDELRISNDEINRKNREKETLLKEIHHRVKNNLQIISSLLNLNSDKIEDEKAQSIFIDCQNRVKSMSLIHEQLYNEVDFSHISAIKYIKEFTNEILRTYYSGRGVEVEYDLQEVYYNLDISVPFGLILNELISNAIKHAFQSRDGKINIKLQNYLDVVTLTISDNGIGFDIEKSRTGSLGLELVETLTVQISGDFTIESSEKGTVCTLIFPV